MDRRVSISEVPLNYVVSGHLYKRVLGGALSVIGSVPFLFSRSSIWVYLVLPTLLNVVVLVGVLPLALVFSDDIVEMFWTKPEHSWTIYFFYAINVVVFLLIVIIGYGISVILQMFLSPFNDILSKKVEESDSKCDIPAAPSETCFDLLVDSTMAAVHAGYYLFMYALFHFAFLSASWVPILGWIITFLGYWVNSILFFSLQFLDYPASRPYRRYTFSEKFFTILDNFDVYTGFGLMTTIIRWIPIANWVVMPLAIIAGTRIFLSLEKAGKTAKKRARSSAA